MLREIKRNKKAQVWVETVIYTLIGLVLIGTVLAFATPVIQKQKDKLIIERTTDALQGLDNQIINVKNAGISNARDIEFSIGDGSLIIDGVADTISFEIKDSSYEYSQVRTTVDISGTNLKVRTIAVGNKFETTITLDYAKKINITYEGEDKKGILGESPNPYRLIVENGGKLIDFDLSCTVVNVLIDCGEDHICSDGFCKPDFININIYDAS